jgi:hypothetical protein
MKTTASLMVYALTAAIPALLNAMLRPACVLRAPPVSISQQSTISREKSASTASLGSTLRTRALPQPTPASPAAPASTQRHRVLPKKAPACPAAPANIPRPRVLLKTAPASPAAPASTLRHRVLLKKAPVSPAAPASTQRQRVLHKTPPASPAAPASIPRLRVVLKTAPASPAAPASTHGQREPRTASCVLLVSPAKRAAAQFLRVCSTAPPAIQGLHGCAPHARRANTRPLVDLHLVFRAGPIPTATWAPPPARAVQDTGTLL